MMIGFGFVLVISLLFVWFKLKSNKVYITHNSKYDPTILERNLDPNMMADMMLCHFKVNDSSNGLKNQIPNDMFNGIDIKDLFNDVGDK